MEASLLPPALLGWTWRRVTEARPRMAMVARPLLATLPRPSFLKMTMVARAPLVGKASVAASTESHTNHPRNTSQLYTSINLDETNGARKI